MSYPILSSSIKWKLETYKKTPNFNSVVQKTAANRGNAGFALKPFCTWDFELELPTSNGSLGSTSSIVAQFIGILAATKGQAGLFLYDDVTDDTIAAANSGMINVTPGAASPLGMVGDGVSTQFQLVRSLGTQAWDIIQNLNGTPTIYVNGTPTAAFSISSTGVVTFTFAPASNATLTWAGNIYFLCRFEKDTFSDLSMVGYNASGPLWRCSGVKFSSEFV